MPKKLLFVILIYFTTPNMTYLQENLLRKAVGVYTGQGDIEKAITLVDKYIATHPYDFTGYLNKAIFVRQKGIVSQNQMYFHETIVLLNKARDLNKEKVPEEIILGNLATTYLEMQDVNNAIKMYEIALESSKRAFYKVKIAYAHARQGNIQKAIFLVEQLSYDEMLEADSPDNVGLTLYNVGLIYSLANNAPEAVKWLELAMQANKKRFLYPLKTDIDLNPIRGKKEFRNLMAKYGV
ncbi:MAG: hypothetical protein NT022_12665 [Deltaproteobacteria bacterium]|nr:hypothetical protein [Deltaproteobacteria bacterium]